MFRFWFILPLFCIAGSVEAKTARLVTFPIPLMVENKDKGLFINLAKEISKKVDVSYEIEVLPPNKAILKFTNNDVDGIFPGLDVNMPKNALKSVPFYSKIDFIFYRKDKPLRTIKDLEGKAVGLTFRYPYTTELTGNSRIRFSYADDDVANIKRLSEGTIDAFVVEKLSGIKALGMSGVTGIDFDKTMPISTLNVYFAFKDNKQGRELHTKFNSVLEKMKADGELDKILEVK
ncbi:substrate-binding periplasmic protein [Bdellovibrio sp. HCB209]|uniref:substrate-binding periplasmic protein n=1 Tax=Bdellovibrio sp. HCB209 TaxID=3394354 RepID=UPI0039B3D4A3